jgi:hypothetical protein
VSGKRSKDRTSAKEPRSAQDAHSYRTGAPAFVRLVTICVLTLFKGRMVHNLIYEPGKGESYEPGDVSCDSRYRHHRVGVRYRHPVFPIILCERRVIPGRPWPLGPRRSGFSLHRTGMMDMLHGLRGRILLTPSQVNYLLFIPVPLEAGDRPPLRPFRALPRSYRLSTPRLGPGLSGFPAFRILGNSISSSTHAGNPYIYVVLRVGYWRYAGRVAAIRGSRKHTGIKRAEVIRPRPLKSS